MACFLAFCLLFCVTVSPAAGVREAADEVWLDDFKASISEQVQRGHDKLGEKIGQIQASDNYKSIAEAVDGARESAGEHVQGAYDKLGEKIEQLQASDNYKSIAEAVDGARESAAASLGHLQDWLTMSPEQQKAAHDAYKKTLAKLGDLEDSLQKEFVALRKAAEDAAPDAKLQLQEAIKNVENKIDQLRSSEGYVKAADKLGEVRAQVQDSIADMQDKIDKASQATHAKLQGTLEALKDGLKDMNGQGKAAYQHSGEHAAAANVAVKAHISELQTKLEQMTDDLALKQRAEKALRRLKSRFELLLATHGEVESLALNPPGVVDAVPEATAGP